MLRELLGKMIWLHLSLRLCCLGAWTILQIQTFLHLDQSTEWTVDKPFFNQGCLHIDKMLFSSEPKKFACFFETYILMELDLIKQRLWGKNGLVVLHLFWVPVFVLYPIFLWEPAHKPSILDVRKIPVPFWAWVLFYGLQFVFQLCIESSSSHCS